MNSFKYFLHRYACKNNYLFRFKPAPTTFAANLLRCRGGSKNHKIFKMELSPTTVNSWKLLTIIRKCPILVMTGFMDQTLTSLWQLWQLIEIVQTFTIPLVYFKDYQHNNGRSFKENQAQIQLINKILIEKLNSSFFRT